VIKLHICRAPWQKGASGENDRVLEVEVLARLPVEAERCLREQPVVDADRAAQRVVGHHPAGVGEGAIEIRATLGEDNFDDWTPDVVRLTSVLPPAERRGLLHDLWDVPALRETVVVVLASAPHEQDRPQLVETLRFGQPATIGAAVDALLQLDENAEPAEIASAVSALRQFSREPRYADVSRSLDRLLAAGRRAAAVLPAMGEMALREAPEVGRRVDGIHRRSGGLEGAAGRYRLGSR
jgi:hypothetical protein